jgi:prophage antirepressor-like protein
MNELQIFNNDQFGTLEAVLIDGKPYFPATRCAEMLRYENPRKAIIDHCPHVTKRNVGVQTGTKADGTPANQTVEKNFIPQGDLLRLITHSKLPAAQAFESWIFDEVVPAVLKHGLYTVDSLLDDPDAVIAALQAYKVEREQRIREQEQRKLLQIKLDEATNWFSVKRWAKEHDMDWRNVGDQTGKGQGWRKLKALSVELGYDIQRSFDANYGQVNAYHRSVFELL